MELPHTAGCIVCGMQNPHGLRLSLHVHDDPGGPVTADFTPGPQHIGFQGIVHGGILSTVLDEAMVWAATWAGKRFCVAGELSVRFRNSAAVGQPLRVEAKVSAVRSRLIETTGEIREPGGRLIATAGGKYVPVSDERNREFVATLVEDPGTTDAAHALRRASASAPKPSP